MIMTTVKQQQQQQQQLGKRRETHYFDWNYNNNIPDSDSVAHYNHYLNYFEAKGYYNNDNNNNNNNNY